MAEIRKLKLADAQAELRAQGVLDNDCATICPICGTVQSMRSLVAAGAPKDSVERYFAFSCEGRFSGVGPLPGAKDRSAEATERRARRGCNWTLGGLFQLNRLTIVYPDGKEHPSFEIATAEQAQALSPEMQAAQSEAADG